jgi:glycosyltransferase involved in cell wall biosynthesis
MPERRYRVLVVASHGVPYAVPVFRALAQHPQLDFHVAYCSLRGAEPGHDPEFGITVQWDVPLLDGYSWSHVPNRGTGRESFLGLRNPGLWGLIRKGNFDAVLLHIGYIRATFWIAYLAARLSGSAFLFGTDASSVAPRDGARWKPWLKRAVWPLLFRLADQVMVPSSAAAEMMRELGVPEERISLTHFVVDNDWWTEQAGRINRSPARAEFGVSDREIAVLFCAKLQDWKRPLDLLRAFAKAAVPDSILLFAGEGPLRAKIESEAAALGIASRVRMLGFTNQSRLPAVYSAADLFVLPSGYDPCPVVVCEAMVCGLPVILSDEIRGRFDIVQPGVTGGIFPCGDVEALAENLRRMLGDRAALAALGANARARMATWSTRENVAATFEAIKKAVSRKKPRPGTALPDSSGAHASPAAPQKLRE